MGILEKALGNQNIFIESLFKRPESLSRLLPYDEWLEARKQFLMKDGSLGVVFEAELLEHEPMTSSEIVSLVDSLKSWFNLPPNCALQVLFEQAALCVHDGELKTIESAYPNPHPVSKKIFEARLKTIKNACNQDGTLSPLRRRGYVSIRYFTDPSLQRLRKHLLKRGESVLFTEMEGFIEESRAFSQIISDFQHNSKVRLRLLEVSEVLVLFRRFFNPKTYYKRSFAPYNPSHPISDQILYNSPTLDFRGIEREGIKSRTLTLKTSPQFAYPGGMAYFTRLPFPFKLSLNFKFPTKRETKTFFDLKEFFLQNTPSARARRQRDEVLEVQEKLARDDRCLHVTFSVIVEGETDEILERRVREVVNVFHNDLDCETILEEDIGLGLCLNSLPLNYSPKSDYSAQRNIRILRSDATKFVPVFDSFRGMKRPLQFFLSREKNLVPFSLLENETSNHTVVLADSGSGKSALVIDCMLAAKRMDPEPLVFVLDKKSSYVMASEYFDGDLSVFGADGESPYSVFRGTYDDEKFNFLTQLLLAGIKFTSPSFNLESIHQSAILRSLRSAYVKKQEQANLRYVEGELLKEGGSREVELSMEDVIAELGRLPAEKDFESSADVIESLTRLLMPFYGDGSYAKYFRGTSAKNTNRKKSLFYIYDLDALDSDPTLRSLMTIAIFEEIRQTIKRPEFQRRGGFIVLEEMQNLGRDNPIATRMVVDFAETMRKLGFWLISLTPRPQNYFELEVGKAMWGVADNFLFLQMSQDNVDYIAKHSSLLDEATVEIIKSLRTKNGEYADVFFINKKKTKAGAFRYFQTPYDRWLSPTNAKDTREAQSALRRFRERKWQALEYLSSTYPKGVEVAEKLKEEGNAEAMGS